MLQDAIEQYQFLLQHVPDAPTDILVMTYTNLAQAFIDEGRIGDAIHLMQKCVPCNY